MTTKKTTKTANTHASVHVHEAKASTEDPTGTVEDAAQPSAALPVEITAAPAAAASRPATPVPESLLAQLQPLLGCLSRIPIILGSPGSPAKPLNIQQRLAIPKMKAEAEKEVPEVLNLADKYGVALPGGTTDEARADTLRAETLDTLAARLSTALLLVQDESRQALGRTWKTSRRAYNALLDLIDEFPALQKELDPMASVMATKHKDAPTVLRQAEAKALSKSRATAKEKTSKGKPSAPPPAVEPVVQGSPPVPPAPAPTATVVQAPGATPLGGVTNGNGAGATVPAV